MSGVRRVCAALAAAALLAVVPLSADAQTATTRAGLIFDDAHILSSPRVVKDVNALPNPAHVQVAVVTTDDASVGKDNYDEDILAYLEQHHAAVTDAGDAVRSDLIVIAVSPGIRQVGVYAGSDVTLDDDEVAEVVAAMRADARAKRWDQSVVRGATKALSIASAEDTQGQGCADPAPGYDEPDPFPQADDPGTGSIHALPIVGGVAGVLALVGGSVIGVAASRRRKERRRWLEWTPDAADVGAALRAWKDTAEQVQTLGYPGQPLDPSGQAVDASAAIDTLEAVSSRGVTAEQRSDPVVRERLLAVLGPHDLLAGWLADAQLWAKQPGWEARWTREFDHDVGAPLDAMSGSVDDLARHLGSDDLAGVRSRAGQLTEAADRLDRDVRSGEINPAAGVQEAKVLNRRIRQFVQDEADSLGQALSASSRRRLVHDHGSSHSGMAPYLLTGLIASNVQQSSAAGWSAGGFPDAAVASTTFIDTSGGAGGAGGAGGGVTGGSGGF